MNEALRAYQSRISDSARQLDAKLADFHGGAVNVTSLFYLYAFDTMGRISYGKSFDLIKTGKQASGAAIEMLREGLSTVGFLIPVPWCFMAMKQFPFIGQKWRRMITWAADQVDQRMKVSVYFLVSMSGAPFQILLTRTAQHQRLRCKRCRISSSTALT